MCRLFAALSTAPLDPSYWMHAAPDSLLAQSDRDRKRKQSDGWGIGWFKREHAQLFRRPQAMHQDRARVRQASRRAEGKALIGHVRWASNPLKLKRNDLIGLAHTQPFSHGRWLFAHNGTLFIPKKVAAELGPWKRYLKGNNDSEVLFYWILKNLFTTSPRRKPGSRRSDWIPASAGMTNVVSKIRNSINGLHSIWDKCKKSYPLHSYPYHGLNWVLTNGQELYAFCYADPRGLGSSKALCDRRQSYYQLRYRLRPGEIAVASEPIDESPDWKAFRHGTLLSAKTVRNRLQIRWSAVR